MGPIQSSGGGGRIQVCVHTYHSFNAEILKNHMGFLAIGKQKLNK